MSNRNFLANDNLRTWMVVIFAIGQIATTFWPLTGLGESAQARSDALPTPLVPIGWTFAIWGVIYLGATAYAIWQFLPKNRTAEFNRHVGWLIAYMYLVNTLWQVWNSSFGFGVVDFLGLASEAVVGTIVLFRINQIKSLDWQAITFGVIPVALLAGWATAASFVGSTVSGAALGFAWATNPDVAVWILATAILVASVLLVMHRHATYGLAVAWASWGLTANASAKGLDQIEVLAFSGMWLLLALALATDLWKFVAVPMLKPKA